MDSSFLSIVLIFLPQIIFAVIYYKVFYSYFSLYRKKINPDYPILPGEAAQYLGKGFREFLKIYLTPAVALQIIFEKHKDKELNTAAKKVRLTIFAYFVVLIIQLIFIVWIVLT